MTAEADAIEYACERCGGVAITRDAWAEWNVATQDWQLCEIFDHAFCHQCHRATRIVERPVSPGSGLEPD